MITSRFALLGDDVSTDRFCALTSSSCTDLYRKFFWIKENIRIPRIE